MPVSLDIPAAAQRLYMSYETTDGSQSAPQSVPVSGNAVSVRVNSTNSRPFDDSDLEQSDGVIHIPSTANGWGTMMFEDTWPSFGDYDFNDVVFSYKVQLELAGASNVVKSMLIGIRIKALCGSFPYELYLQMHGVEHSKIANVELVSSKNTVAAPAMTLLPAYDPASVGLLVFSFWKRRHEDRLHSSDCYFLKRAR